MSDRFMTMEEIRKVPVEEMVRLMENEEYMTPCEYYIEHDDVPKWLKTYNRIIMYICYTLGRDVLRPILIFLVGKEPIAAGEYVLKHHEILAMLYFLACLVLGATLTGDIIGGVVRLLTYILTGEFSR